MLRAPIVLLLLAAPALAQSSLGYMDDCGLEPPGSVIRPPLEPRAWEPVITRDTPPVVRRVADVPRVGGLPAAHLGTPGALSGKTVYLSPGHGFTWTDTVSAWRTQRPNTNDIVEDLVSTETLSQYLVPMLLNAGATVVPVRETDLNTSMVIVDNDGAGYQEAGTTTFQNSSLTGFAPPTFPISGALLPFSAGTNRLMNAASTVTGTATYTATLPKDGEYNVYASWTAFTARVTDAHYIVRHAGGETHFRVNQQRHGGTWVLLGRFFFRADTPAQVLVQNDSADMPTGNVSLDAIRFGGGMGFVDRGSGVSGRPFFEESSRYYSQWAGAPASVFAASGNTPADDRTNDVGTRSRFSAWVNAPGEDAVYVAWHTNAFNASAVGTDVYVYGPNPPDGTYQFTGTAGSDRLAQLVHGELIGDIEASSGWNQPGWRDRGIHSAYFGEINPNNNNEMPAILVEVAFHDAAADALHLKEPGFRYLAARAFAQGIIKYFAEKDMRATDLPPEAPTHLSAVNQVGGTVALRWHAPPTDTQNVRGDAATGYRVYTSVDGNGWDNGTVVTGTTAAVAVPAGQARFFRVTATNAGGESFPSVTVGARAPDAGQPLVLVVNGYDRLEAAIGTTENLASYTLANVLRIILPQMNDGTYVRRWGDALNDLGVGFDSAQGEAMAAGEVALDPYTAVAWFAGRGKQGGGAPTSGEQAVLGNALAAGKRVIFSGRAANDANFIGTVLSAGTGTGTAGASVTGGGVLGGLSWSLDDGKSGAYATGTSDVLFGTGSAVDLATYGGGGSAGVGVPQRSAYLAFPFETIVDRPTRIEVLRRLLTFVEPGAFDGGIVEVDAGQPIDAGQPGLDAGADTDAGTEPWSPPKYAFTGGGCTSMPFGVLAALALLGLLLRKR